MIRPIVSSFLNLKSRGKRLPVFHQVMLILLLASLSSTTAQAQEPAPSFSLVDINGKSFELSAQEGEIVLIDFFYTTCPPCIEQIPHLQTLKNEYSEDTLTIISIGVIPSETDDDLRRFSELHNMDWVIARDTDQAADKYGVSYVPHLVIIDSGGYKRHDHVGLTSATTLSAEISALLGQETDSGQSSLGVPFELIAVVLVVVIVCAIVGVVLAGQRLEWSKPSKKRQRKGRTRILKPSL